MRKILIKEDKYDKEALANELRRRIGSLWPLRGSVACFHELYLSTKLSAVRAWSQWGGFAFVDLKRTGKFLLFHQYWPIFLQNSLICLATKSSKYPHPQPRSLKG